MSLTKAALGRIKIQSTTSSGSEGAAAARALGRSRHGRSLEDPHLGCGLECERRWQRIQSNGGHVAGGGS
jgi:hypothetical protein